MAASIRHSSTMLRRIATQAPSPARCFTTTTMNLADRRGPKPAPRVNPLIGGFQRTPKKPEQQPEPASPPFSSQPAEQNAQSSARSTPPPPPPPPGSKSASSAAKPADANHTYSATSNKAPMPFELDVTSILSTKAADYGRSLQQEDPTTRPRVRTVAATGRTVFIRAAQPGANTAPTLTSALGKLNRLVREQKVKQKYHSQKAHERAGIKRKRLRSERWRERFHIGFGALYARVHELRKQGW